MQGGRLYLAWMQPSDESYCTRADCTSTDTSVHVTGHASSDYQSEETPMKAYGNLHIAFEQMRVRALAELRDAPGRTDYRNQPPRVLVLGPSNSGKTTVCKILVNYAVRSGQGWTPLVANIDPAEVRRLI